MLPKTATAADSMACCARRNVCAKCGVASATPAVAETAGAGKSSTLEGTRGRETWGTTDGDGLVHLAIDELFGLVHGKAVTVGEMFEIPWQQQQFFWRETGWAAAVAVALLQYTTGVHDGAVVDRLVQSAGQTGQYCPAPVCGAVHVSSC